METIQELRKKSDEELIALVHELKKQLFEEKNRRLLLAKEAPGASLIGQVRRQIARTKTILRERELEVVGI